MNTFYSYVLMALVIVPFGWGVLLAFLPRERLQHIRLTSAAVALVVLGLTAYVFLVYDTAAGGYQFIQEFQWLDSLGITLSLGVDGISVPMVLLTGIVMFTGVLISWNVEHRAKEFFVLFFLLVAGVFGVFVSLDLFFFFFFYELAVMPMYLLIGIWGSSSDFGTFLRPKEYGAMKLMLYLVAGSVLVWVALIAVFVEGGIGTFSLLALEDVTFSENFQRVFFPMFMIGFGILAGLWPFHTWSPDGHVAAPTSVSMLHAGVLMKLGAYGIIRIGIDLLPQGAEEWMPMLIILGTVNVVYGAVSAMGQRDLKYVVGYSSVSHMGYVLMGFATLNSLGMGGAVLQMFSHGIMTALLFALVGVIYDRAHIRDIGVLEGLTKRMGLTAAFFAVAGLTSLGLPGLSGFVAELMVFLGVFRDYPVLGILGIVGAAITAVYILRLLAKVFFGP
ncbi:MAG: NADH-quinone oxidoreductase subunit M, partial [Dehalococcoidia bacterium]|nr:NADH-quinone oxidoreductase subunit M [Dehalococcoidia bacterium]